MPPKRKNPEPLTEYALIIITNNEDVSNFYFKPKASIDPVLLEWLDHCCGHHPETVLDDQVELRTYVRYQLISYLLGLYPKDRSDPDDDGEYLEMLLHRKGAKLEQSGMSGAEFLKRFQVWNPDEMKSALELAPTIKGKLITHVTVIEQVVM